MKTFNEWVEERIDENLQQAISIVGKILNKVFNPIEIARTVASVPMASAGAILEIAEHMWKGLSAAVRLQLKDAVIQFGLTPVEAIAAFLKTLWHATGNIQRPGQEVV